MKVNTCALIVDNFEVTSRNDEVNVRRIQATRQVSTSRRKKKKNKAPGCFSDSSEAITSEYVLSPGERKLEHSARLVVNTRRMARVIIFGRAMSIYDTTTLCIRASYTKIKHANATHRAKEAKATSWVHAFVCLPTGVANFQQHSGG